MANLIAEPLSKLLSVKISEHLERPFQIETQRSIGGGCISQALKVSQNSSQGNDSFFVKLNRADQLSMFEAERDALKEMYATGSIRVPEPLACGAAEGSAYIVMEWLELGSSHSSQAWEKMGRQLAQMHQCTSEQGFGWHRDNTIGATPQKNGWCDDWVGFWRDRRLGPQFSMAHAKGGHFPQRDELMNAIPRLLRGHTPTASLLHGDLWSGNAFVTTAGEPIILDPATYYGDSETDLAMTELFGRLPAAFYQAYDATNPINSGYAQRKTLYNLYHILNHFNLFGGGYASQANSMIKQILN
ncbi:MAG: fructosamine kinase family protein [Cyanobacteria bacterium J06560_6]